MEYPAELKIVIEELATQVEIKLVAIVRYKQWTVKTTFVDKSWLYTEGGISSDKLDLVIANIFIGAFK